MKPFSICIIAKNEEKYIARCLDSIKTFDCEIVVVDTGSTDRTKEIASKYTSKIFDFVWVDDFSAARNFSLSKATYDWILVLDCDEWVEEAKPDEFIELARTYPSYIGRLTRKNLTTANSEHGIYTDPVERFFNRRYYHYEGTIHEQVMPLTSQTPMLFYIPLTIFHSGYIGSKEDEEAKRLRNMTMLERELAKNPNDPYLLFQMGQEYYCMDNWEKAAEYYSKVLSYDLSPTLEYLRLTIQAYGSCLLSLGRIEEALQFENIESDFGTNPDFAFLMGRIYFKAGLYLKAMGEFIKATTMTNAYSEGTNTYLSWYYIALIYEQMGDISSAKTFYLKCGDFEPAMKRLHLLQ